MTGFAERKLCSTDAKGHCAYADSYLTLCKIGAVCGGFGRSDENMVDWIAEALSKRLRTPKEAELEHKLKLADYRAVDAEEQVAALKSAAKQMNADLARMRRRIRALELAFSEFEVLEGFCDAVAKRASGIATFARLTRETLAKRVADRDIEGAIAP